MDEAGLSSKDRHRPDTVRRDRKALASYAALLILINSLLCVIFFKSIDTARLQISSVDFVETVATVIQVEIKSPNDRGDRKASIKVRYLPGIETDPRLVDIRWGYDRRMPPAEYAERHPVGSLLTIYYNPAKPDQFVLERGLRGIDLYGLMMFSCASWGILLTLIWFGVRMRLFGKSDHRPSRAPPDGRKALWLRAACMASAFYLLPLGSVICLPIGDEISLVFMYICWAALIFGSILIFLGVVLSEYLPVLRHRDGSDAKE